MTEAAKKPPKKPNGPYMSERKFERIARRLAEGKTLEQALALPGMPTKSAFYRWLERNPDYCHALARARDLGDDAMADEAVDIADASTTPTERNDRLRVEARLRRVAIRKGARAGAQVQVNVGRNDGGLVDIRELAKDMIFSLELASRQERKDNPSAPPLALPEPQEPVGGEDHPQLDPEVGRQSQSYEQPPEPRDPYEDNKDARLRQPIRRVRQPQVITGRRNGFYSR
jgi:hypothetical protein